MRDGFVNRNAITNEEIFSLFAERAIRRIAVSKPSRPASYVRQVRASCAGGLFLALHPNIALSSLANKLGLFRASHPNGAVRQRRVLQAVPRRSFGGEKKSAERGSAGV